MGDLGVMLARSFFFGSFDESTNTKLRRATRLPLWFGTLDGMDGWFSGWRAITELPITLDFLTVLAFSCEQRSVRQYFLLSPLQKFDSYELTSRS